MASACAEVLSIFLRSATFKAASTSSFRTHLATDWHSCRQLSVNLCDLCCLRTISHIQIVLAVAAAAAAAPCVNHQHRTPKTRVTIRKLRCQVYVPVCRLPALQSTSIYNMLTCHTEVTLDHAKRAHMQPSTHDRTQHDIICTPMLLICYRPICFFTLTSSNSRGICGAQSNLMCLFFTTLIRIRMPNEPHLGPLPPPPLAPRPRPALAPSTSSWTFQTILHT